MAGKTTIETPRLILRAAHEDDTEALFKAFSDPEVMRYWSEPPHANQDRTRRWLHSMTNSRQNGITDFIVCLKPANQSEVPEAMGKVGVYSKLPSNEIGFLISRQYWRTGLATEVLTAMLNYLFSLHHPIPPALRTHINDQNKHLPADLRHDPEPGIEHTSLTTNEMQSEWLYPSISADTDPRNAASIGVLEKLGFAKSAYVKGTLTIGDEIQDSQYLRLTREQWLDRQATR